MKQFKFRSITSGLLGALLLLGTAAPLTFTSCENEHPEINITLTSDYSGIIDAINNVNKTLLEKLALIEQGIKDGNLQNQQALDLIQKAIEAMNGTLEQKLDAIKTAIESQTTSLETKLDLIEAALKAGFTDQKTALGEIKSALESIKGSVDGLDSAIDDIVASIDAVTDSLGDLNDTAGATNNALTGAVADALADIFAAIDGLSDYSEILEAIKTAIENIEISGGGDDGKINGYEYVEMGDGLKWATMNVGATKPEEYGDYFAWGETEAKTDFTWATYKWMQSGQSDWKYITKYTIADEQKEGIWYDGDAFIGDNKTSLEYSDDAARQIWKGTWRIPTDAEWTALRNEENFKWDWTDDYEGTGIAGRIVTSKVEGYAGNTIFLPAAAAGLRHGTSLSTAGSFGYCWSSSLSGSSSVYARRVYFSSEGVYGVNGYRDYGFSVRPVSE